MVSLARPFLASGAALVSVAVMATAAPAVLSSQPSTPNGLSAVSPAYTLTAASDISGQGLGVVLLVGWGDFIGPDDPYFPGQFTNDLRINGPLGVAYYVIDNSMNSAITKDLENYIFEVAALETDPIKAVEAAARAAAYVAVASNLGVGSVPAKLAKTLIYGVPFDIPGAIVQLAAPIPLVGDITSVYFTGRADGDPALYGTGLNGLVAYSGTLLPWLKPLLGPAGQPKLAAAIDEVAVAEVNLRDAAVEDVVVEDATVEDVPAVDDAEAAGPAPAVDPEPVETAPTEPTEPTEPMTLTVSTEPTEPIGRALKASPAAALDEAPAPSVDPAETLVDPVVAAEPEPAAESEPAAEPEPAAEHDNEKSAPRAGHQSRRGQAKP